jgi:FdhD protein
MLARVTHEGQADDVAVEEPLEIRVGGEPIAVTMRTPGNDEELALGFLFGEGLIDGPRDAEPTDDLAANAIEIAGPLRRDPGVRRFYMTSSCGVCGKGALEQVAVAALPLGPGPVVSRKRVAALFDWLAQHAFAWHSGGLHAAALFAAGGEPIVARKDVDRHNALDKVVGWALRERWLPLSDSILCVSGRLAFELVQKAGVAGCPILIGVGAPTSLAIELADERGMTLCGFAYGGDVTVYSGAERLS